MRLTILGLFASLALFPGLSATAEAHVADTLMWRPYVIQKTCNDHFRHCKTRMSYAPGEHPGLAGPGTYFYKKAVRYRHGDFRLTWDGRKIPHKHLHKKQHTLFGLKLGTRHHRNDCRRLGWGFDHRTGPWAWVPKMAACLANYDGP